MPKDRRFSDVVVSLGATLAKEAIDAASPCPSRCLDAIRSLADATASHPSGTGGTGGKKVGDAAGGGGGGPTLMTVSVLEETKIGKVLTRSAKSFRRHRRSSSDPDGWDEATAAAEALLSTWREAAEAENAAAAKMRAAAAAAESKKSGLPGSAAVYRERLMAQRKEMYKNPPAMPPPKTVIESAWQPQPKRNKATGELTFLPGDDSTAEMKKYLKEFHPNCTPEEVLRAGSFGGTYFRPIVSAVTNVRYSSEKVLKDTVEPSWINGMDARLLLTSSTYRESANKFGVKCGGSLGMWESSGWMQILIHMDGSSGIAVSTGEEGAQTTHVRSLAGSNQQVPRAGSGVSYATNALKVEHMQVTKA
eukprot:CAMPEP_0183303180 /NCGR_PEP_ID=MMETSP0160_2-20130417/8715_1 /TAXON_ID=2839 ORGANISM="Odontella Sinensis, Strain Grunow 1884" /NCGR_SAMPLE_ID=MMETSP0160_2 /ASSEMBLY_ACC=CAM_ASM_000250 /LENGTH=362 /DNA_ID=CAMNT_0025466053 /DNA_START=35 /DNA_END=1124 /DNA_ORIENTATION=-